MDATQFFWRTTKQQEIDLIEDRQGELSAFEFKWNAKQKVHFPQTFTDNYPNTQTHSVSPDNVEAFLLPDEKPK